MADEQQPSSAPRVCIVAEFYPREQDPVLGIWAHRQAVAARDAGAEVRVLVLHRPVPPRSTRLRDGFSVLSLMLRQPPRQVIDGITVDYVRFFSPPRTPASYGRWGRWAAKPLAKALRRLKREFDFEIVHAHNAVPAGDAFRIARSRRSGAWLSDIPLLVSVHGGDVFFTALRSEDGKQAVTQTFASASLVVANSEGTAELCKSFEAERTAVLRLGTDVPSLESVERWLAGRHNARQVPDGGKTTRASGRWGAGHATRPTERLKNGPMLVTLAHVVARKRHEDVIRAVWMLRQQGRRLRYRVIGDGPELARLQRLAEELEVDNVIEWMGQLPHEQALEAAREADIFVMPSVDEAFGVAYVEAMAASMPAIASLGESGPTEISGVGEGILLVPPGDIAALAGTLARLIDDPASRRALGRGARRTVTQSFTWELCGKETVSCYRQQIELKRLELESQAAGGD